jgi:hypothetical protein
MRRGRGAGRPTGGRGKVIGPPGTDHLKGEARDARRVGRWNPTICWADRCETGTTAGVPFCAAHWALLPDGVQAAVLETASRHHVRQRPEAFQAVETAIQALRRG